MSESRSLTRQAIVLAVLAGGLARLAFTDAYLSYVQPSMRLPLIASVTVIAILTATAASRSDRLARTAEDEAADDPHPADEQGPLPIQIDLPANDDHDHHHTPWIGYMLVLPVLAIALVPIRPLGTESVSDRSTNAVAQSAAPTATDDEAFDPDAPPDTLLDFISRVINDPEPIEGEVTLVGFVADEPSEEGFVLARFVVSCCAADAIALTVNVVGAAPPPVGTWVEVTGTQVPPPEDTPPEERVETRNIILLADDLVEIDQPEQPYEDGT
ncbi:MAG: TIGR03943 family protein [Acidimicrobiales bacterium]|nr:TIGR03943 family protein [Acidimicrobiales bacterium]